LYWGVPADVPRTWQLVHWVFTLSVPVCQLGVVWPPWQLTLEQVSAVALNDAAPDLALYAAWTTASPGDTRSALFPGRALAWL
jgi:hypothetical protein